MAAVAWPSTLPKPSSDVFSFTHKRMGNTLAFASGRHRVVPNRSTPSSQVLTANLSFRLTLAEYDIFCVFYDDNWIDLAPQSDTLTFSISGVTWEGWPISQVNLRRDVNTWEVSFSFEFFFPYQAYTFSAIESDALSPVWPTDEFPFLEGASFKRIVRGEYNNADNLKPSKAVVYDDSFVKGQLTLKEASIDRIFRFYQWWLLYCRAGAVSFRIPSGKLPIGTISGFTPGPLDYYAGKIVSPPSASFSGGFGTITAEVVLTPYPVQFTSSFYLVTNNGDFFGTNGSNRILGVT